MEILQRGAGVKRSLSFNKAEPQTDKDLSPEPFGSISDFTATISRRVWGETGAAAAEEEEREPKRRWAGGGGEGGGAVKDVNPTTLTGFGKTGSGGAAAPSPAVTSSRKCEFSKIRLAFAAAAAATAEARGLPLRSLSRAVMTYWDCWGAGGPAATGTDVVSRAGAGRLRRLVILFPTLLMCRKDIFERRWTAVPHQARLGWKNVQRGTAIESLVFQFWRDSEKQDLIFMTPNLKLKPNEWYEF